MDCVKVFTISSVLISMLGFPKISVAEEDATSRCQAEECSHEQTQRNIAGGLQKSDTMIWDADILNFQLARVNDPNDGAYKAYQKLLSEADDILPLRATSVMDKQDLPGGRDKHDYWSFLTYFWPKKNSQGQYVEDPSNPFGAKTQWINDEASSGRNKTWQSKYPDLANFDKMMINTITLTLAYFYSKDEKYAEKARELIWTWFINDATKMTPHMKHAQGTPGKNGNDGTTTGIIDAARITFLLNCIGILKYSPSFTNADMEGMKNWARPYLSWLVTSQFGKDQSKRTNNHALWYDAQVASLYLFLKDEPGNIEKAKTILKNVKSKRIDKQIDSKGKMPEELRRPEARKYTHYALQAMAVLAQLADYLHTIDPSINVDLWGYNSSSKKSIRGAMAYIIPFCVKPTTWKSTGVFDNPIDIHDTLRHAMRKFPNERIFTTSFADLDNFYKNPHLKFPSKPEGPSNPMLEPDPNKIQRDRYILTN